MEWIFIVIAITIFLIPEKDNWTSAQENVLRDYRRAKKRMIKDIENSLTNKTR